MANLETVVSDFLDKRDNLITTAERLEELIGDVSESKTLEKRVTAFLNEFFLISWSLKRTTFFPSMMRVMRLWMNWVFRLLSLKHDVDQKQFVQFADIVSITTRMHVCVNLP